MNSSNRRVQNKSKVMVMDKSEVICISSGDENEMINDKQKPQPWNNKANKFNFVNASKKIKCNNQKQDIVNKKRKISEIDGTSDEKDNGTDKRIKTVSCQETNSVIAKDSCKQNGVETQKYSSVPVSKKIVKPQLIIKEKKNISLPEQDIFPSFLSLCLQKRREPAMEIIVNKLKRRYEQMNPVYAKSEAFQNFLNNKRSAILSSDNMIFQHIMDVKVEMKKKSNKNSKSALQIETNKTNVCEDLPSSSKASSSSINLNNIKEAETDEEGFNDDTMNPVMKRKLKKIKKVMNMCSKRIKILEESEVNFDDEDNSNFIKLEKYKERMVKLYNEYCRITGDNQDAGRSYLRPKHLNTTQISSVDYAITNFINAKITKRNKLKKSGRFTDDLIFPDYRDILKCVSSCNERNNLGLTAKKRAQIAKKAFTDLGEHLQRARRIDYWDTFSLFLENKQDDPALKDLELAQKLRKNQEVGQQKLTQIFQDFVKKQEEMNSPEKKTNTENGDNEDSDIESKDEDENSDVESKDEDENSEEDDEDKDENIDNSLEDDENENKDDYDNDNEKEDTENKQIIINSESNENEIKSNSPENETRLEKDLSNTCKDKDNRDTEITNVKEVFESFEKVIEKTSPATESEISVIQQSFTLNNNDMEDKNDEIIPLDDDDYNKTTADNKPILRVRSFAKHPTTWEDNKQKIQNAENGSSKEVIDLTNDVAMTKVSIPNYKVKTAIFPSITKKYKGFLMPANLTNKSLISVKNITNNYLKLNPSKVNSSNLKPISIVKKVVDLSSCNTIVHLPHSSGRQNIRSKENNNETIKKQSFVHVIIPTEVYNKNSVGVPVKKNSENKPK
ncbi:PREDICTED: death domain-associated protein 6 [Polistes canadensis]|uniref:death domain-associated protein 6 n=1 Tax=Polistes canadensis TaxID=91411 RepID=UPI000718F41D|nr:PREDICTED: death domain-associated protein 6 [Polistes canadensis]